MEGQASLEESLGSLQQRVAALGESQANLVAIADWSAATYIAPGVDRAATLNSIQEYMKDALITVTQQIAACGGELNNFLEQQNNELHMIDSTLRLMENRLSSQKEQLARQAVMSQFMRKLPVRGDPIAAAEVPEKEPVFRASVSSPFSICPAFFLSSSSFSRF